MLLAREAEGSMRDAQSLLEQILSYAAPGADRTEIDERLVEDILGVTERRVLYEISHAVIAGDAGTCVDLVARVVNQGKDVTRLSKELVEHFRNLLVLCLTEIPQGETGRVPLDAGLLHQVLDLPDQEIEDLRRQAADLSTDALLDYFRFMAEGDEEAARSPYPRFALEATLIRLATLPATLPVGELLERLETLEEKLSAGGNSTAAPLRAAAPQAVKTAAVAQTIPSARGAGQESAGDATEVWKNFVAFVTQEKKFLAVHLEQARPLALPPGPLTLGVEEHHLKYLQDPEHLSLLKDFARRFFSEEVSVSIAPLQEKKPRSEEAKTDPEAGNDVVREALRIFGGSVKRAD